MKIGLTLGNQFTQRGRARRQAEAQKVQRGEPGDGARQNERQKRQSGHHGVGQDVSEHDLAVAQAQRTCRLALRKLTCALQQAGEPLTRRGRFSSARQGRGVVVLHYWIVGQCGSRLVEQARTLLKFTGHVEVWGERLEVKDWVGMQGHNWGREHAWEYAWGQCSFVDDAGEPFCSVEGFSGKLRLAGRSTPYLSAVVVRRGEREYRFDRVFDFWRQEAEIDDLRWTVSLKSADGEARLAMQASARDMVCLGYHNPDGRLSYCMNSKLARVELRVNPTNEEGFEVFSEHGGALELLRNTPDPRFAEVV